MTTLKLFETGICRKFFPVMLFLMAFLFINMPYLYAENISSGSASDGGAYLLQQNRIVTGKVVDQDGEPIPGVTVMVKGTSAGTITDINGIYNLPNVTPQSILVFSFIGMRTQEVPVGGQTSIQVTLSPQVQALDEVVVVGYGTMRRSDLTGSVVSVTSEDLNRFPAANVTEMLRGQAAGVIVRTSDASPGGSSSVRIRGDRSLSSNQNPLYIVDGMIVPHINDLNSNDIESMEILKDASSQAIYGARASNGVILITTKRGKEGRISVNLDSYVGFQQFQRNFDFWTPEEWLELRFWAKYNDGIAGIGEPGNINAEAVIGDAVMYDSWQKGLFTDWEDLMLGNAVQHRHDLSIRGGSNKVKYSTAFGYLNQDGIVAKSGYERGSFRLNTDFEISEWMDLGTNISYTQSSRQTAAGTFNQFITRQVLSQPYDEDGNLNREVNSEGEINPLWLIENHDRQIDDEYTQFTVFSNIRPFKGFDYRFSANIRSNSRETGQYYTKDYPGSTGEGSISRFARNSWLIDNVFNYSLPLDNDLHSLKLTFIQSAEEDLQKTTGLGFINSTTDLFKWNVAADSEIDNVTRSITRTRTISFAGRLHYNLLNRYLFTATFRRDGASVFGSDNKWGNFPSAAIGWRIDEESFLQSSDWIDLLRLRVSYGVVGNWAIPAYRTLGLADSREYLFGNSLEVGYLPSSQLLNPDLRWETTGSLNIGTDFTAYNGRINASVEHYRTQTTDLLIQRTVPSITGYERMWDNLGETASRGWEFALNGRMIDTREFMLRLGATVSTQDNKIVRIDGRLDEEGNPLNDLNNNWFIGEPINVSYNYVFGGIWQLDEIESITEDDYLPGDAAPQAGSIKLADYNGDGKITTDDRRIYNLDPKWYGTFNVSALYKGIDLTADFYTVQGVIRNNPYLYSFDEGGNLTSRRYGMRRNYWTPDNPTNDAPRPQYTASVPFFGTLGYQDASYIRLRSLTLGYTLPASVTQNVLIQKARIYFTGTNLFTFTEFQSYGPESSPGSYPEAQTFTFGVNLSF